MSQVTDTTGFAIPTPTNFAHDALPSERFVQVGIATMVALGTVLLGMGERNLTLPVLAVMVAVSSVYLTDIRGWLRLNGTASNVLAVLAVTWTVWDFTELLPDRQLLAVANLLVYLQFILQYQKKYNRTYWLLALLSLLQAAVSTALNLHLVYGLLLLLYMFVSLATMTVFYLYRETVRQRSGPGARISRQGAVPRLFSSSTGHSRPPLFTGRVAIQIRQEVTSWIFARQILMLALGSLVLTMLVFVTIPRASNRPWQQREFLAPRATVGFTDSVSLGQIGTIANNPASVMRAQFFDLETREPYKVRGELYFRGVVLTNYFNGRWTHYTDYPETMELDTKQIPGSANAVRQVITLEPLESNVLFSVYPLIKIQPNENVLIDVDNQHLLRPRRMRDVSFPYELVTTGLQDGRQLAVTPTRAGRKLPELRLPLVRGVDPLARLRTLAAELVADIPRDDHYERIRAIEAFLQDPVEFGYTMSQTREDPSIDPIVDFVLNTREGHCEYFASAMVLMLRSVGVPARIVVGYKSDEWNPIGGYFMVRQLHAHAWAEAYLAPSQIPETLPVEGGPETAAWLRLDPTPQYDDAGEDALAVGGWNFFRQFRDYLDFLWSHFVLGMDSRRQQEHVYTPVVQGVSRFFGFVQDPQAWRRLGQRCLAAMGVGVGPNGWVAGEWFYWRAGLVAMVLSTLAYGFYRALRLSVGWFVRRIRGTRPRTGDQRNSHVEFYRRLENTLQRHHMQRPRNQTQREFAEIVGSRLADHSATQAVAGVPGHVAGAFYRVRFGQTTLDNSEADAVEHALIRLENALAAAQETNTS